MAKKTKRTSYRVVVGSGYVQIQQAGRGEVLWGEVLYWDRREWEEDPEVVFAIVKAVILASSDPAQMDVVLETMRKG